MHDEPPGGVESEGESAGDPTGVLGDFVQRSPGGFVDRFRSKVHRKMLMLEVVDLSWRGPALILMQWLLIVFDFLRRRPRAEGAQPDE